MKFSFVLCAALAAPSYLYAAAPATLDPVIVTAERTPTLPDQTIGSVVVITRADIERLQARDLVDLLRAQPGLAVAQSGGRGQQTSVFVRGNESRNTLVLIDGRRAGTVELPGFSWEYLPVDDIERIEIVPGARSSLYGSQAFGGVINIITRKDASTGVRAGGGNRGSEDISGHTGWRSDHFDFGLGAGQERTSGYDITTPANFGHDPDRDGYDAHHVGLHAGADLGPARVALDSLHNQGRTEFDQAYDDFRFEQHRLGAAFDVARDSSVQLDAGFSRDRRLYDPSFFIAFTDSQRRSASAQFTQGLGDGASVIGGFDYAQDRFRTTGEDTQRITRALFVSALPKFGALTLEGGARREWDNAYGGISTGQLGARYAIDRRFALFARGGSAFRAPTFEERFGGPFNDPNPGLKPERTVACEIGGDATFAAAHGSLSVYENRVRDLITYTVLDPNTFEADYQNVARARLRGVELKAGTRLLGADLNLGWAYLDARDSATHAALARRPHQTARLDADRRWGNFSFGTTLSAEGRRPDGGSTLGGFALVNLRASWTTFGRLTWELAGFNVLDRNYTTVATYRSEPVSVRAGVAWRLGN